MGLWVLWVGLFLLSFFFGSLHPRSYMYMNPKPMFDFIQIQTVAFEIKYMQIDSTYNLWTPVHVLHIWFMDFVAHENYEILHISHTLTQIRLRLVREKVFPENRYFSEMLFSGKENVFMCLVAFQKKFQKIFSDVWLYSWKYHRKHIFHLLLIFSHIFSATKQTYNVIHS